MKFRLVVLSALIVLPMFADAQDVQAPLEPPGAILLPATEGSASTEIWDSFGVGNPVVRNVTQPTLTPFLPDPSKATGAAVVVAPGGAFMMLSMQTEGWQVARWLADHGVAAFVLKYRTDTTPVDAQEFRAALHKKFTDAVGSTGNISIIGEHPSTQDALASLRLIRNRAAEWHVDPTRVGVVGFSAGAMLAIRIALAADATQRPNFAAAIYPPLVGVDVPPDAPPLFVAVASDDPLFGNTDFSLIQAWHKARRPIEFHYYDAGGHGFGMVQKHTTSDLWIDQFYAWMNARSILHK